MENIHFNDIDAQVVGVGGVYSVYKDTPWNYDRTKQIYYGPDPCYLLMYVQQGSYYHRMEGKESHLVPARSLVLSRVERKPFTNCSAELPFRYITIRFFTKEALPLDFEEGARLCFPLGLPSGYEEKFSAALQLYTQRQFGWKIRLRMLVEELVLLILKEYYEDKGKNALHPVIADSVAVIRRRIFAGELSVGDVARECHVSTAHLIRTFRDQVGMTPKKYMDGVRVERACELLRYTDKSIDEIAGLAGFSEARQLRHVFRESMGVTPQEYRRNL